MHQTQPLAKIAVAGGTGSAAAALRRDSDR
jgi:hypothetical protein